MFYINFINKRISQLKFFLFNFFIFHYNKLANNVLTFNFIF